RTKKFGVTKDVRAWNYTPEEEGIESPNNTRIDDVEDMGRVLADGHLTDEHEASAKYLRWKLSAPDTLDVQIVGESEGEVVVFESHRHVGADLNHAKLSRRIDNLTTESVAWVE